MTTEPEGERAIEPPDVAPPEPVKPPEEPAFTPKLTIGIGLRTGLSLNFPRPHGAATLTLQDGGLDPQFMFRPFFAGQLTKKAGVFVQGQAGGGSGSGGGASFLLIDAYIDLKFHEAFGLLIGQHIPANDRNDFEGPFFNNSWNFATVFAYPMNAAARDRGFTAWGLLAGGHIKYHASMVNLQLKDSKQTADGSGGVSPIYNARYAGRITINLLEPEKGYYSSGTYWGKQDTLAIGGVFSYQRGLKVADGGQKDDGLLAGSLDLFFEKNFGFAGTITAEFGYWNFNGNGKNYGSNTNPKLKGVAGNNGLGGGYAATYTGGFAGSFGGPTALRGQAYQINVSWLSPHKIGVGQLQPNARLQGFDNTATAGAGTVMMYDAGLAYIVDGFNHQYRLNYQHISMPHGSDSNSVQFGIQMQI